MLRVRWLFFDLGDTLWRSSTPESRQDLYGKVGATLQRWLETQGCSQHIDGESLARAIWDEVDTSLKLAERTTGHQPDPGEAPQRALASRGLRATLQEGRDLWSAFEVSASERGIVLFPDARATLEALARRGLRLGVITNRTYGEAHTRCDLACLGLDGYFEHVIVSADVGHLKPHPRIFQAALSAAGARAQECALVGDNLRADVQGAKDAGLFAIWKRSALTATDHPVTPDATIDCLVELLDVVETLR